MWEGYAVWYEVNAFGEMREILLHFSSEVAANADDGIAVLTDATQFVEVAVLIAMDHGEDADIGGEHANCATAVEIVISDVDARRAGFEEFPERLPFLAAFARVGDIKKVVGNGQFVQFRLWRAWDSGEQHLRIKLRFAHVADQVHGPGVDTREMPCIVAMENWDFHGLMALIAFPISITEEEA